MDPTLQKRLIGAIVLIVAAIVFVPMLLDGPGHAGTETVDLGIPEPGPDGMRTELIALDAPVPMPPVANEGNASPTRPPDEAPAAAPPAVSNDPAGAPESVVTAPTGDAPPPGDIAPTAAVTSEQVADSSGRWHVTLGSYANADNARKLVADMRSAGLPARAEPVTLAGKPVLRVRIGPYADRVRAEAVRIAVAAKRRDVTPALVQDESSERAQQPVVAARVNGADDAISAPLAEREAGDDPTRNAPVMRDARGWVVQIGAFAQVADANAQVDQLRAAGYAAFVDRLDAPGGTLHRVRVGPEAERAGAHRVQASLRQSLAVDGVVMRHP